MTDLPTYPKAPLPAPVPPTRGEQSAAYEGAFSKPGTSTPSKGGWKPAKGTRFRSTVEKARGRPRKHARDRRKPIYY